MSPTLRRLAGNRSDWHLRMPVVHLPRPRVGWVGPLAILGSILVSWPAFSGARGDDGNVSLGLYVGAVSILLMAWSFVLAIRIKPLEPFFGGLDSMYRAHRWSGALAVVFMFWHTQVEPEIDNGIRGAAGSVADQAQELAGVGEIMLYVLIGLSLVRIVPYRFWRWTHKLLGVPFAFASWHFFTTEKPYANGSAWGWWFGGFMVAGLAAYLVRVVGRDMAARGRKYRVSAMVTDRSVTTLELAPVGRPLVHRAGQFAFLKVQHAGLSEPHAFTIASSPDSPTLRFVIRELGDWTRTVRRTDLVGTKVIVEGPYGTFEPFGAVDELTVWIAGGVGITPFLSAIDSCDATNGRRPHLFYAVRSREDNTILDELERAHDEGRIELHAYASADGERLEPAELETVFGSDGLAGAHVGLCGPTGLVNRMETASRSLGATTIHREDFDIRQGFGPDLSIEIDDVLARVRRD